MKEEHIFLKIIKAKSKQKEIKMKYGYEPTLFKIRKKGAKKWKYAIVEPKGLVRINK